jgi:nuclear GTP-binding protein
MLMTLLGNYCRSQGIKTAIRVGVVGFPNVGKSSVINSLKRNRACGVGATPGLTKTAQEVSLDKHIKLIDSPGIVFAKLNQFNELGNEEGSRLITSLMALRNATKVETLEDPITPVEAILSRVQKDDLLLFYRLPDFKDCEEFLALLAARIGKLKKGGVPNRMAAARKILTDWNSGKIKYFTVPPETHTLPSHISAEIVSSLSAGFRFDADLVEQEMEELDKGISSKVTTALCMPSLGFLSAESNGTSETMEEDKVEADSGESDDDECESMAVDDTKSILGEATRIQLRPRKNRKVIGMDVEMKDREAESKLMSGLQLNKAKKVQFKKDKKQKKRQTKATDKLASTLDQKVVLGDYDFDTDFAN